jgi:predicted transposase/invertase (TIGR01784 family)
MKEKLPEDEFAPHRPHDSYFEQVFKILPIVRQLIQREFPPEQLALLDLDTLELSSESYITDESKEFFSDLVYVCQTTGTSKVRICLLFEHKSGGVDRKIFNQLEAYMLGVRNEDYNQKRPYFSLTIPVIFYHGLAKWTLGDLRNQYGPVPEVLMRYIPQFEYVLVNIRAMSDESIFSMQETMQLRNIYLAFKHAWDNIFFRQHYQEILSFAVESMPEGTPDYLYKVTFLYLQTTLSLKEEEIMDIAEKMPPRTPSGEKTTYEQIFERGLGVGITKGIEQGIEKGIEQGIEKGIEKTIYNIMRKHPEMTDQQVADFFDVSVDFVKQIRARN